MARLSATGDQPRRYRVSVSGSDTVNGLLDRITCLFCRDNRGGMAGAMPRDPARSHETLLWYIHTYL